MRCELWGVVSELCGVRVLSLPAKFMGFKQYVWGQRPATKPLAMKNELCSVIDKTYFLSSSLNQAQTTGNDDNVAAEMVSKQAKNKPIGLFTYHFKATWQVNDILFRVHRLLSLWVTRSLSTFCKNPQLLWQHIS